MTFARLDRWLARLGRWPLTEDSRCLGLDTALATFKEGASVLSYWRLSGCNG
jgi:hypothetical protein